MSGLSSIRRRCVLLAACAVASGTKAAYQVRPWTQPTPALVLKDLHGKTWDLVALQVLVSGLKDGARHEVGFRLIDYFDVEHGISAMMRTTGYSLSITGQMQADGRVVQKGVRTPDEAMPFRAYVDELARRGIRIEEL